jgi:hypothetical protein
VVEQDALMQQEMVTMVEVDDLACIVVLLGIKTLSNLILVGFFVFCIGACFAEFLIMVMEATMKVRCVS